ncbi:ABC transporter permease [Winogradskyella sp. HB-48]|uniref:ABC transporter permease n=1 Tax=Winogradskyella sp. HB-48 TaxID=3416808 RepID=UPI003CEF315A
MGAIKSLFKLKNPTNNKNVENNDSEDREQIRITYYQSGYGASSKAFGDPLTFRTGLHNLYNSFEDQCRKQSNEQQKLKQPFVEQQEKKRTELKKRETIINISEEQKEIIENDIKDKRFEIVNVKQNPEEYGIDADKKPKAQFYIGLGLLLPITIYLFVFYISASYSAFFKDFESGSLTAAIFDANALSKAISDGWLEGVFVGTIPFVFMGLGYLVHMFQKSKEKRGILKLAALFVLTFLFDVILAYLIEKKIFEFDKVLGDEFSPQIALQSVNFWGIIFAGFVVYLIWGLVFDFVMKEHENVDKIKGFIRNKKEEIKNLTHRKNNLTEKINSVKQEITGIKGEISELQSKIDGFIFPIKEYLHYHYQYKEGWYQAINAELALPNKEKMALRNSCEEVSKEHLDELKLDELEGQNLIFTNS